MLHKQRISAYLNGALILLMLAENYCLQYFHQQHLLSNTTNAILFFTVSVAFGILLLCKFYNKQINSDLESYTLKTPLIIALIVAFAIISYSSSSVFKSVPINITSSDIIPSIQIVVNRFLSGEYAYSPMTILGYTTPVGYMPLHWMPFTLAELLHIDYRWIVIAVWCIALGIISYQSNSTKRYYPILILLLVLWEFYSIVLYNKSILAVTVELLIAAYYMLFITGINQRNYVIQGITFSLCILSRFSLLLWLPLWSFTMVVSGNTKSFIKTSIVIISIVTLLYILPFLSKDWSMFFNVINAYSNSSWEWQHLCANGLPCHLYNGVGFAHLFYEKYGADNYLAAFNAFRKVFFIVVSSTVILSGIWYWLQKSKMDYRIFIMASFKIYLSVFLAFMIVPYEYLMVVGNFVSIAIFAEQLRYKAVY